MEDECGTCLAPDLEAASRRRRLHQWGVYHAGEVIANSCQADGYLENGEIENCYFNHRASGIFTCEDKPRNKVSHGPRGGILSVLALCSRAVVNDNDVHLQIE